MNIAGEGLSAVRRSPNQLATRSTAPGAGSLRRLAAGTVVTASLVMAAVACGGGGSSSGGGSNATPASTATSGAAGGTAVTATETDFKIALSRSAFTPGTYTFTAQNKGQTVHALEIDGPGVAGRKSATISPGASTNLTVALRTGSYELFCPVDGHKDLGMDLHITVS
jgi:uncharacterized cupredoxin-like copper-binding protein